MRDRNDHVNHGAKTPQDQTGTQTGTLSAIQLAEVAEAWPSLSDGIREQIADLVKKLEG